MLSRNWVEELLALGEFDLEEAIAFWQDEEMRSLFQLLPFPF